MRHIIFVAQKGTSMSYFLQRQLFAARLSSFDWISKPSRVLFLEKKEPHNHLFVQISNPHSVHNFSNETLSLACFQSRAASPTYQRIMFSVQCSSKWRWNRERKEKTENNAMTPFIIGIALTNMMNGNKWNACDVSVFEPSRMRGWNCTSCFPNFSYINLLSTTICSFWSLSFGMHSKRIKSAKNGFFWKKRYFKYFEVNKIIEKYSMKLIEVLLSSESLPNAKLMRKMAVLSF